MKFVLAFYGSRGDIEPCVAVGGELLRRGHDVRVAVSPNMVGFAEAAGLAAVPYGLDLQYIRDVQLNYLTCLMHTPWKIRDLIKLEREAGEVGRQCWTEMTRTLTPLADGADLLFTGIGHQELAANVAEYYEIPFATLHYLPVRPNGQLLPFLPSPLARSAILMYDWLIWRMWKQGEDAQRRELGLPKTTGPVRRRIAERGSLEIQGYDEVCFPGLAAEWANWKAQRPFVGALTMELPTDADGEVESWIAAGTPPIFFGFGSTPVKSAADTLAMISGACAQLGERALVCSGVSDFSDLPILEHVKVVRAMNYAAVFPACRALVHHGGAGTTAAGLRAGVPTLVLSMDPSQALSGAQVKRLKVGTARRFSSATQESLVADLRTILAPRYIARAREIAAGMTKPAESVAVAADLLIKFASQRSCG